MIHRFWSVASLVAVTLLPAVTSADTVYFVSKTTGGLYSFNTSGTTISTLAAPNTFTSPSALALGPDGNLYVGDGVDGGRVARYIVSTGSVSTVVSLASNGPVNPGAIAFRPTSQGGEMLVGRNPESAFFAYPTGSVLQVSGWGTGQTAAVQAYTTGTASDYSPGLAVAADGSLYVSNAFYDTSSYVMTGNVLKFDSSGTYQAQVSADGSRNSGLYGPAGLALAGNSLYIASTMDGWIYKTDLVNPDTSTNTTRFASTNGDYPGPLATISNGDLLVGSVSGPAGLIYQFDSTGDLVAAFGTESYGQIGGIVAVPEPSTALLALAGLSLAGLWRIRRRRT